ncbi:MAG: hypothetical protein ACQERN_01190 [Thermodesulfobacteriota bacterium]
MTKSTTKKKSTKKSTKKKTAEASAKQSGTSANTKKSTTKKPTIKSLRKRHFGDWAPQTLYTPAPDKEYENNFAAPPSLEGKGKTAKQALLTKQFDEGSAKPKKAAPKKKTSPKSETKGSKKAAPKKESAQKETKTAAKSQKKKAPAAKKAPKKSVTRKELIGLRFGAWTPEKLFKPEADAASEGLFTAPPAFEATDKSLLFKQFDLSAPDDTPKAEAAEPAPEPPPVKEETTQKVEKKPEKEPVPVETLLKMQFDTWSPEKPFAPAPDPAAESRFTAPPAFEGQDKALLLKQFDLSVAETAKETPAQPAPEPEPAFEPQPPESEKPEQAPAEEPTPEAAPTAAEAQDPETTKKRAEAAAESEAEPAAKTAAPQTDEAAEKPKPEPTAQAMPTPEKPQSKDTDKPKREKVDRGGPSGGGSGEPPEPPKPPVDEGKEPMGTGLKIVIATLGIVFALIIAASATNFQKYYIKSTEDGVEIWRGDFSPRGKHKVVTLAGAQAPEKIKDVYSRNKPLSLAFNYYMDKADALSGAKDLVDFKAIKHYLEKAKGYATTNQQRNMVIHRLNGISAMMLMYKADVAAEKQTEQGYEKALDFLEDANKLNLPSDQQKAVNEKIAEVQSAMKSLEAEPSAEPADGEASEKQTPEAKQPATETEGKTQKPEKPSGKETDKSEKSDKPSQTMEKPAAKDQPKQPETEDSARPDETDDDTGRQL